MFWIPMAIGAAMGAAKGVNEKQQAAAHDKFRRKAIEMSPWTGMSDPGAMQTKGMMGNILGGAATGGMIGSMIPDATAANASMAMNMAGPKVQSHQFGSPGAMGGSWQNMQDQALGYQNPFQIA